MAIRVRNKPAAEFQRDARVPEESILENRYLKPFGQSDALGAPQGTARLPITPPPAAPPPAFGAPAAKKPPNPNDVQVDGWAGQSQPGAQNPQGAQGAQQSAMHGLQQRYQGIVGSAPPMAAPVLQKEAATQNTAALADGSGIKVPSQESQQSAAYGGHPLTDTTQPMAGPTGFVSFQQRYGANAGAAKSQADILSARVARKAEIAKDALARDPLSGGIGGGGASQGTNDLYANLADEAGALGFIGKDDEETGAGTGVEGAIERASGAGATQMDAMYTQAAGGADLRGLNDRYKNAQQDVGAAEAERSPAKAEQERQAALLADQEAYDAEQAAARPDAQYDAEMESKIQELMTTMGYTRERAEREVGGNRNTTGYAVAEG